MVPSGGDAKNRKMEPQEHWNRDKNHEDILATEGYPKMNDITQCKQAQTRI